jgi:hypothetical protein
VKLKTIGGLLLALICAIGMTVSQSRADNRTAFLSDHPLCEPGTQWDGAACTAVPNCPVGQRWSGTGCVAVECGSGYRLEGSFCVPNTCPTGQRLSGNRCVAIQCNTGFRLEGSTCMPLNCPAGQRLNGNTCEQIVCGPGEELIGNTCTASGRSRYLALAVGQTNHLGYGAAWDKQSVQEAQDEAMRLCQNQIPAGSCKIILSGPEQCLALWWTPTGTGWGAARRPSREEAKDAAAASCANINKRQKCVLAGSWCNT